MLKKNSILLGLLTSILTVSGMVEAAQGEIPNYTLDSTVVTATKTMRSDLNTPASTIVITEKELVKTGADNIQTALAKVPGIAYKSFGPGGAAFGSMTNEIAIRGVGNGTLLLVNGSPLNQQGKAYLDAIPVDTVRRVEIIKGASSVLYGSDAMAGVINIITKKEYDNKLKLALGDNGQRTYQVQGGLGKVSISYTKQKMGNTVNVMDSYAEIRNSPTTGIIIGIDEVKKVTDFKSSDNEALNLTYNINNDWNLLYNRYKTVTDYAVYFNNDADPSITKKGKVMPAPKAHELQGWKHYENRQDYIQLLYNKHKLRGTIFYNATNLKSRTNDFWSAQNLSQEDGKTKLGEQKYKTYGFDIHKKIDLTKDKNIVGGISYEHQSLNNKEKDINKSRKVYSLYGQWDQQLTDKNEWIFGLRGTWSKAGAREFDYHNLSASTSFIHKLDQEQSLYMNVAQSFIMPTLNQMYGSGRKALSNPDLKPQKGINYELGWKKKYNNHNWKVALYKIDIKDNITASYTSKDGKYKYFNEKFKNLGIELGDTISSNKPLSYQWSVSYSNPQVKSTREAKNYWDRKYGRWQLTGQVNYQQGKLSSSLQGSYFADRVTTPNEYHSYKVKPYFITSLTTSYKPDKHGTLTLAINNLLNRKDNIGYTGTRINTMGRNFRLSYNYKF